MLTHYNKIDLHRIWIDNVWNTTQTGNADICWCIRNLKKNNELYNDFLEINLHFNKNKILYT
jgi:hypothetical protein